MPSAPPQRKTYSLRSYLVIIVMVAVLPVLLFSAFMVNSLVDSKRRESRDLLLRTSRELALAFDQEVVASLRTLDSMAQSEILRRNDLRTYHEIAIRTLSSQKTWRNILLLDSTGIRLLSARHKFGEGLGPAVDPASVAELFRTGEPSIGNIRGDPADGKKTFAFAIRVPVRDTRGEVKYALSAVISLASMQDLVNRFSMVPGEWTRAIVDPEGILAARSRDPEKFVGGPASESLRAVLQRGEEGIHPSLTLDGVAAFTGIVRGPTSKWHAAIAVPEAVLVADSEATRTKILLLGLMVVFFSATATYVVSNRITQLIRAASDGAAILAKGETPAVPTSPISEIEELRASMTSAAELLASRDRAKSDFLANMSHELRTPLGIVLGMTDLLSKDAIPTEERPRTWEIVQRNGQQLLRLINDILDFSKLEAHRLIVENLTFNLRDLTSAVIEDFSVIAAGKKVALRLQVDKDAPLLVNSDPVRVRQVISNLVDNAIKFTSRGSVEVQLRADGADGARVTVRDTGIGLDENQQARLFQNFTQGDSSHTRKYGGTGLGLSLARKLARLMDGDVVLTTSRPLSGSEFTFTFKTKPTTEVSTRGTAATEATDASGTLPAGTRILLAEDSEDNVVLVKHYLKPTGAHIDVAGNGIEAVRLATEGTYDLILMDIQMPALDGYAATLQIRGLGIHTPIIALTAHALDEHRHRALAAGCTGFLTKPIKKAELLTVVSSYVRDHR